MWCPLWAQPRRAALEHPSARLGLQWSAVQATHHALATAHLETQPQWSVWQSRSHVMRFPPCDRSQAWDHMISLMVGHNLFTGEIPDAVYRAPFISFMDISGNK